LASEILEVLFRDLPVGVLIWKLHDPDDVTSLRLVSANAFACELMGVDLVTKVGQTMVQIFPATTQLRLEMYADAARSGQAIDLERLSYADDRVRVVTYSVSAIPLPDHCVAAVFESFRATDEAARELRDMSGFLDSIVENIPAMIFVKDAEGLRFRRINRAGEALLGIDRRELVGKTDYDFFPRDQADAFTEKDREVLRGRAVVEILEEPVKTPTGERWLHTRKIPVFASSGEARYLLGISQDITERREAQTALQRAHEELELRVVERTRELAATNAALKLQIEEGQRTAEALREREEQLRQAQRMEAVGRLAGGIAHDFNNLLSVTISYATLFLEDFTTDDPRRADAEAILSAGLRAAELTRQLLAFSRQQMLAPKILDLNTIIAQIDKMIRRIVGEDIDVTTRLAAKLDRVRVDPGQIEQVVMNLIVNARDAMPKGGKLTIETGNVVLDESWAEAHEGATVGPQVMLAITDTGVGMDAVTRARVFEPFFTTKEVGKGTGLGLSTVFGIVKQSGGSIYVYSEVGVGTGFKIYFPRAEGTPEERPERPSVAPGGDETILLVEDESRVRALARTILTRLGYTVLEAANLEQALKVFDAEPTIDLLLTDVVMPHGTGRDLAHRLQAKRPELPVLFMSGYTDDTVVRHGVLEEGVAFVQKPLTPGLLAVKVREALDRGTASVAQDER